MISITPTRLSGRNYRYPAGNPCNLKCSAELSSISVGVRTCSDIVVAADLATDFVLLGDLNVAIESAVIGGVPTDRLIGDVGFTSILTCRGRNVGVMVGRCVGCQMERKQSGENQKDCRDF